MFPCTEIVNILQNTRRSLYLLTFQHAPYLNGLLPLSKSDSSNKDSASVFVEATEVTAIALPFSGKMLIVFHFLGLRGLQEKEGTQDDLGARQHTFVVELQHTSSTIGNKRCWG